VLAALQSALAAANGNMRARTLSDSIAIDVAPIVTGKQSGRKSYHGGSVANAYKYPATAAALYCYWARLNGRKHVLIVGHQVNAKSGSGIGHPIAAPTRDKLDAEGRLIELVYPAQYVADADIARAKDEERPFLRAIKKTPTDAAPRLIYADWLDEQGRTDEAIEIRSIWMKTAATAMA
jgi:uncharacterized protein (TIGR02996 family)